MQNFFLVPFDYSVLQWDLYFLFCFFFIGVISFIILFFQDAPYGKLQNDFASFLPKVEGRLAFCLQEFPSFAVFIIVFLYFSTSSSYSSAKVGSNQEMTTHKIISFLLFVGHYFHRSLIYPWFRVHSMAPMNVFVMLLAAAFTTANGYFNAKFLLFSSILSLDFLSFLGLFLFVIGFYINFQSDSILNNLRIMNNKKNEDGDETSDKNEIRKKYSIPRGGLFEYVSCANYFGEVVEWFGYYILTRNLASLCFFLWTNANLVPRAISQRRWYIQKFGKEYPTSRKAIFPFIL